MPIFSVLLLGILGATAPCQLSTNLGAVGYLTNKSINKEKLFNNTLWYTSGKLLTFLIYGIILIIFKINFQQKFVIIFSFTRKLAGPLIILVGLNIIGMFNLNISLIPKITKKLDYYFDKYNMLNPAFVMGIFFSLAFCPTLFWLFFGLVIPLALKSSFGLAYPAIFALGTLLPMIFAIIVLGLGKDNKENLIIKLKKSQRVIKLIGGGIITLFGVIDTIIYFFI